MDSLFIAEIGINHHGNLSKAFRMIRLAKESGAHIAKFQHYEALKVLGLDHPEFDYANLCQFSKSDHEKLAHYCQEMDIEYLVSVFDVNDVAWADSLCKRHKVATRMNQNLEFLSYIDRCKKPVIMSVQPSLTIRKTYRDRFYFMWCVQQYPSRKGDVLKPPFSFKYGLSSHCPDYTANVEAYDKGARIFENHVVESREETGCDVSSSLTFAEYKRMTDAINAKTLERVGR